MMSQDGFSIQDKARYILEKFCGNKVLAIVHCDLIISEEFYGSHKQNYYKKIKKKIEEAT